MTRSEDDRGVWVAAVVTTAEVVTVAVVVTEAEWSYCIRVTGYKGGGGEPKRRPATMGEEAVLPYCRVKSALARMSREEEPM